ncbi:ABC transporter permease [Aquihabitans sp. G128]|uniref:ABC transporter permease n=1 Tax=Aquihabitans sp. G128 TaxID=2849779 RepID=UPI001C2154D4|nr:ABC transporter permease [Aquihabitans sp. G128]QXC59482.1 ABC transporter permease [Aquihabitans sp. G128]
MTAPTATTAASPAGRRWWAQTRIELLLTLRRGESILLTFAIPVVLLAFFSLVDVLPTGTDDPVDFLFPGVLALAVMSTALVSVAIATGFERQMGVLKRLGSTPLSRGQLLGAKTAAVVVIEALQIVVLVVEGTLLGFRFSGPSIGAALLAAVLATIAFAGLGLLMAGTLPALTTLAAANGVYLLLLLLGGMVIPLSKLPSGLRAFSQALPSGALAEVFHGALGSGSIPGHAWVVLAVWAVIAPVAAARFFRWE